jgi:hypothetical protein
MDNIINNIERIGAPDIVTKRMMLLLQYMNEQNRELKVDLNDGSLLFGRRL